MSPSQTSTTITFAGRRCVQNVEYIVRNGLEVAKKLGARYNLVIKLEDQDTISGGIEEVKLNLVKSRKAVVKYGMGDQPAQDPCVVRLRNTEFRPEYIPAIKIALSLKLKATFPKRPNSPPCYLAHRKHIYL